MSPFNFLTKNPAPSVGHLPQLFLEGFSLVFKANPYHDEKGQFSTEDKAKTISGNSPVWHGSASVDKLLSEGYVVGHKGAGLGADILGPGMYVTPSKDYASKFGDLLMVNTTKVKLAKVSKEDLYVLTQEKSFQAELRSRTEAFFTTPEGKEALAAPNFKGQLIAEHFLKRGYDGVFTKMGPIPALDNGFRTAMVLYNPRKSIKSLSKLEEGVKKSEILYAVHPTILPRVEGFSPVFKANPYHDSAGRFARANAPHTHHFVSTGGKFQRSNDRDRTAFGVQQTAIGNTLTPIFDKHKAQRLARIQGVVDEKFNTAPSSAPTSVSAPAPAPRSTRASRPPTAAQAARTQAAAQREAIAARRAELVAEREALVRQTPKHLRHSVLYLNPIDEGRRGRLQAVLDDPTSTEESRRMAAARLAGAEHGARLAEHGLTPSSTLATAARVPPHHLAPDSFGRSLADLNAAHAARQEAAATAQRLALGESWYNMTPEERRASANGLSRARYSAASAALREYAQGVLTTLDGMPITDRQSFLNGLPSNQRSVLDANMSLNRRQRWNSEQREFEERGRAKREGPYSAVDLSRLNDADYSKALSKLTPSQRKNAGLAEQELATSLARDLENSSVSRRLLTLDAMTPRQRQRVEGLLTPEQRDSYARQRADHDREAAEQAARAAEHDRMQRAIAQATIDNLPPPAKKAFEELSSFSSRGMQLGPPATLAKLATALAEHYPKVSPARMLDALAGKDAKLSGGSLRLGADGNLSISTRGGTVHGAKAEAFMRDFDKRKKTVEHSFLRLAKEDRGLGAVKKHFIESVPLYLDMGMEKIKVHGALEGGFHTWARYGFDDDSPPAWHNQAKGKQKQAYDRIPSKLKTPEVLKEIEQLEELSKKYGDKKEYPRLYTAAKTPHLDAAWAESGNGSAGTKSKFKFDAQANGNWYGTIRFKDKDQMQHLSDYLGADMPHIRADGSTEWVKPRKTS